MPAPVSTSILAKEAQRTDNGDVLPRPPSVAQPSTKRSEEAPKHQFLNSLVAIRYPARSKDCGVMELAWWMIVSASARASGAFKM